MDQRKRKMLVSECTITNVGIGNVNKVCDTLVILGYCFQITPGDIIRIWSKQIIIFTDSCQNYKQRTLFFFL